MTPSLVEYVESCIIPRYASFDKAHREDHARVAEDHRASATTPPRSIYGALVAEADRMIVPETIIRDEGTLRGLFETIYAEETR